MNEAAERAGSATVQRGRGDADFTTVLVVKAARRRRRAKPGGASHQQRFYRSYDGYTV
jgi:hypothetical protein